jgi:hypothetical protein
MIPNKRIIKSAAVILAFHRNYNIIKPILDELLTFKFDKGLDQSYQGSKAIIDSVYTETSKIKLTPMFWRMLRYYTSCHRNSRH